MTVSIGDYAASTGEMIGGLEKTWKEVGVAYSRCYAGICLQEVEKATKTFNQNIRCSYPDSNREPQEYKSRELLGP
jgi:hypothetical protein